MKFISKFFYSLGDLTSQRWFGGSNSFFRGNRSYLVGQKGPVWIDTDNPRQIYYETPQVKMIYDKFGAMYSNMNIQKEHIESGEIVEDKELQALLENPNPMQSQNEWLTERITQLLIMGNQFTYKNKPSSVHTYPVTLMNPSPFFLKPYLTGKIFDQVDLKGIIDHYEFNDPDGYQRRFETEDILWARIPGLDDPLKGVSKLVGYKYPISNIVGAYMYLNVISFRKGAIGMLSNESSKDSMGSVPLLKQEKERIQTEHIDSYGIREDQKQIILTEASLKWTPMSYPTKDLILLEQIEENTKILIDALHMNVNIFSMGKSTYENVRYGYIQTYQDAIQPFADLDMQRLTKFLDIEPGYRLKASYDHLQIMKENKLKGLEGVKVLVETLTNAIQNGLITVAQAQAMLKNELKLN
jgi:hypothetical protein